MEPAATRLSLAILAVGGAAFSSVPKPEPRPSAFDLVFANTATALRGSEALSNDGKGVFAASNLGGPYANEDAYAVTVGDINGDGHDELFFGYWAASPSSRIKMHWNNGSGLSSPVDLPSMPCGDPCSGGEAAWFNSLLLADVNKDGFKDLVADTFDEPNFLLLGGAGECPCPYPVLTCDSRAPPPPSLALARRLR